MSLPNWHGPWLVELNQSDGLVGVLLPDLPIVLPNYSRYLTNVLLLDHIVLDMVITFLLLKAAYNPWSGSHICVHHLLIAALSANLHAQIIHPKSKIIYKNHSFLNYKDINEHNCSHNLLQ